ncbi:MAG: hypothetical protein KGS46_20780, partial [Chloroflexi bacterium]|nr:hypothetical protein [Chloroflexota bacterium]
MTVTNSVIESNGSSGIYSLSNIAGVKLHVSESQIISHTSGNGIYIANSADYQVGTIRDTQILSNSFRGNDYAIFLSGELASMELSNNTGVNNNKNGVYLGGVSITGTVTLPNQPNFPYIVASVSIPRGQKLIMAAGSVAKFDTYASIQVNGELLADGTSEQPVYFTSVKDDAVGSDTNNDGTNSAPAAGNWYNIYINSGGQANLKNAVVRYGGSSNQSGLYNRGTLTVTNSVIERNGSSGIYSLSNIAGVKLHVSESQIVSHTGGFGIYIANSADSQVGTIRDTYILNNSFRGNEYAIYLSGELAGIELSNNTGVSNNKNGVYLGGVSITGTVTLPNQPNFPYVVSSVSIPSGQKLIMAAGSVVKFASEGGSIQVYGELLADGTSGQPVYFTSLKDDTVGGDTNNDGANSAPAAGNWRQINVAGISNLNYAIIKYGGYYESKMIHVTSPNAQLYVSHSVIAHSSGHGVYVENGLANLQYSSFENNGYGIYFAGNNYSISHNSFIGNDYGVYNASAFNVINVPSSYWSDGCPYHTLSTKKDKINYYTLSNNTIVWKVNPEPCVGSPIIPVDPTPIPPDPIPPTPPGVFTKTYPNGVIFPTQAVTLAWTNASGASHFGRCIRKNIPGPCAGENYGFGGLQPFSTSEQILGLEPNTTFWWQVRAYPSEFI